MKSQSDLESPNQPNSDAILSTFQALERERSKSHARTLALVAFFSLLLILLVAGFAVYASMTQTKLMDAALQARTTELEESRRVAEMQASASMKELDRATSDIRETLGKRIEGVASTASQASERVQSQNAELNHLREELKRVNAENGSLMNELQTQKKNAVPAADLARLRDEFQKTNAEKAQQHNQAIDSIRADMKHISDENAKLLAEVKKLRSAPKPQPKPQAPAPQLSRAPAPAPSDPTPAPQAPSAPPPPPATRPAPEVPAGVKPPAAPAGLKSGTLTIKAKKLGTIPWRAMLPE